MPKKLCMDFHITNTVVCMRTAFKVSFYKPNVFPYAMDFTMSTILREAKVLVGKFHKIVSNVNVLVAFSSSLFCALPRLSNRTETVLSS